MTKNSYDEDTASYWSDMIMKEPIEMLSHLSEGESESESSELKLGKY